MHNLNLLLSLSCLQENCLDWTELIQSRGYLWWMKHFWKSAGTCLSTVYPLDEFGLCVGSTQCLTATKTETVSNKIMSIWQMYMCSLMETHSLMQMRGTHMRKQHFYTSLAPCAASWDTNSDKSERQLKLFNLENRMRSSICMCVHWMERKKMAACVSPSHFQVMPVGFPNVWQWWDPDSAGTRK